MTTRITLNLGLRYEFYGPLTERNNYLGVFNPNVDAATTPAIQQIGPGRPYYNASYDNVSPRFGVAWDVRGNGKTVVRAGANLLSDYAPANTQLVKFSPFGANFCLTSTCDASHAVIANAAANAHTALTITSSAVMGWNTAANLALVPALNGQSTIFPTSTVAGLTGLTCSSASPCQVQTVVNPNFHNPRVAEWNLDIQRAITNSMSIDVAYVGNHGFHEGYQVDLKQPAVGSGFASLARRRRLFEPPTLTAPPLRRSCTASTAAEAGQPRRSRILPIPQLHHPSDSPAPVSELQRPAGHRSTQRVTRTGCPSSPATPTRMLPGRYPGGLPTYNPGQRAPDGYAVESPGLRLRLLGTSGIALPFSPSYLGSPG